MVSLPRGTLNGDLRCGYDWCHRLQTEDTVKEEQSGLSRRRFLGCMAVAGSVAATAAQGEREPGAFELEEATVRQLQEKMQAGELTARGLAEVYLRRIAELDGRLRSIIETNPDALEIAGRLDQERREKGPRGGLHGIPVVLKDNIDTSDRMTTTAGSLALAGSIASRDSFVAQRLREAGAILLAKANLSEWANFRSEYSTSGWSARGGQCRNPYALDRNPCGSSSGSAVAVSANLCAVAVGTETNGSIVCPANANGIVGLKPTVGLVGRSGIIPISHSLDTAGPMARSVADAALLLTCMTGRDPRDPATAASRPHVNLEYTLALDPGALKDARIGVARQFSGFHPGVDELFEISLETMKQAGAQLIDPVEITGRREMGEHSFQIMLYEFKADLNAYLRSLGDRTRVKSLSEVIAFNEKNREREMPHFGQDLFLKAEEKGPLSSPEYLESLEKSRALARKSIDDVLTRHRVDVVVAPAGGPAWLIDWVNGDHFMGGSSSPAAIAGYPNITVPMGFVKGLPVGISFFGEAWSETKLIRLAYAFEQVTKARRAPRLLSSV
jgi:amidase